MRLCAIGVAMTVALLALGWLCGAQAPDDGPPPRTPEPAKATLSDPNIPLSKALAALSRQTGIRVEDNRGDTADPTFAVNFNQTPFWQALDFLAARSGANVSIAARSRTIALTKRASPKPAAVSHSGPFRVAVKKINSSVDLDTGVRTCTAALEVAWEPSLQPLFLETRPQKFVVKDDRGAEQPTPAEGSSMVPVHGVIAETFTVPLPPLSRDVKQIGLLQGDLSALGPSKMLTFTFDGLDQIEKGLKDRVEAKRSQDGVTCKVTKLVLVDDRWTVQISLDYPPGANKLESFQSWMVNNEIWLEDNNKNRLPSSSYLVESSSQRRAVLSYNFVDQGKTVRGLPRNWHVVYRTPASIVEMPFSFRFENLELP
jgi:hypothetical protein